MPSCVDYSSYRLYEPSLVGGPRVIGLISRDKGERMVRNQTAETGVDCDGETLCFRLRRGSLKRANPLVVMNPKRLAVEAEIEAQRSNTAFSKPEVEAIAGTAFPHGRSLTMRLTEEQRQRRQDRKGRQLPAEDLVEQATNKLRAWEQMGPALKELTKEVACL